MFIFITDGSPARAHNQCWIPLVANHFPPESPFTQYHQTVDPATAYLLPNEPEYSPLSHKQNKSVRRTREVTFHSEVEEVPYIDKVK